MGTGTSVEAAIDLDRYIYACDIDQEVFGVANSRVDRFIKEKLENILTEEEIPEKNNDNSTTSESSEKTVSIYTLPESNNPSYIDAILNGNPNIANDIQLQMESILCKVDIKESESIKIKLDPSKVELGCYSKF